MIDYAFKSEVLKQGFCEVQRGVSRAIFLYDRATPENHCEHNFEDAVSINSSFLTLNEEMTKKWKEAEKINHAWYERKKRLETRIGNMLKKGTCLFVTLTFTDSVLQTTSFETRRRYISRFFKTLNCQYVANVDFGKENGREHYHAITLCDHIDNKLYNYGAINFKKIKQTSDVVKLAKYVSKLANHAIKETTRRNALLYSR